MLPAKSLPFDSNPPASAQQNQQKCAKKKNPEMAKLFYFAAITLNS
jgi:hypothetical protein